MSDHLPPGTDDADIAARFGDARDYDAEERDRQDDEYETIRDDIMTGGYLDE